ncbi:MAG: hypothetical protein AAF481_03740 [Acidobacteriota bacterium]
MERIETGANISVGFDIPQFQMALHLTGIDKPSNWRQWWNPSGAYRVITTWAQDLEIEHMVEEVQFFDNNVNASCNHWIPFCLHAMTIALPITGNWSCVIAREWHEILPGDEYNRAHSYVGRAVMSRGQWEPKQGGCAGLLLLPTLVGLGILFYEAL